MGRKGQEMMIEKNVFKVHYICSCNKIVKEQISKMFATLWWGELGQWSQ